MDILKDTSVLKLLPAGVCSVALVNFKNAAGVCLFTLANFKNTVGVCLFALVNFKNTVGIGLFALVLVKDKPIIYEYKTSILYS